MDVINSTYPVLGTPSEIIWDLRDFDKADPNELLTNDAILQPTRKNESYVTFCKCDFNIKSLINEKATVEDLITGWTTANEELKLGGLAKWSLHDSLYNLYLTKSLHEEPDTLLMLRFVYWYYKCSRASESFKFKKTEIQRQLTKGLLNQREKIGRKLDAEDNDALIDSLLSDLESIISGIIKKSINQELKVQEENYRNAWFKAVWNMTSELLFTGICAENDFNVTFASPLPDFIVDGYPVQMKSLNTPYDFQSLADAKRLRKEHVDAGNITYELVVKMILDAIHSKLDEIDNALERGAEIVFLNGTSDNSGQFFSQFCFGVDNHFSVKESITSSIQLLKVNDLFIPLIFCATGIRLKNYVYTLPFQVPIRIVNGQRRVDRDKGIKILKNR
jgi:hypothetical protein